MVNRLNHNWYDFCYKQDLVVL